jgi:[ribosomal protein S5]-alanine N-acetyltransferase
MRLCPIDLDGSVNLERVEQPPVMAEVIAATTTLYGRRGFSPPWIGYVAVESDQVVGSCGFAAPAEQGEAEIAYFTFPGREGRGVATRMAKALMSLSQERAQSEGIWFVAHTLPVKGPSTSILAKLGFTLLGSIQHPEDGEVWKWRQDRNASEA